MSTVPAFLGNGLITPFRRDQKNDFANATGRDLVESCAAQVLGTRARGPRVAGELRWRGQFGTRLYLLRHQPINLRNRELAKLYAQEGLKQWEPRVVVTSASLDADNQNRVIRIAIGFDVIARNVPGNMVAISPMSGLTATVDFA